jgi:hypothetical protein
MSLASVINLNTEFFVWDAIVSWRDHINKNDFYRHSKSNYFNNMLKLIESNIVDIRTPLKNANNNWLKECKDKIDEKEDWALSTKKVRKSCLNTFYQFTVEAFDKSQIPYQRHPKYHEIEYILSPNINEKDRISDLEKVILKHSISLNAKQENVRDLAPIVLCNEVSKINERDAYIVWLILRTGQSLDKILDLKKENIRVSYKKEIDEYNKDDGYELNKSYFAYLDFENDSYHIEGHVVDGINNVCKNSKEFIFETKEGKRIHKKQVIRNLKEAGYNIGLDFDLTPSLLKSFSNAYMSGDIRSEIMQGLGLQFVKNLSLQKI